MTGRIRARRATPSGGQTEGDKCDAGLHVPFRTHGAHVPPLMPAGAISTAVARPPCLVKVSWRRRHGLVQAYVPREATRSPASVRQSTFIPVVPAAHGRSSPWFPLRQLRGEEDDGPRLSSGSFSSRRLTRSSSGVRSSTRCHPAKVNSSEPPICRSSLRAWPVGPSASTAHPPERWELVLPPGIGETAGAVRFPDARQSTR